MATSDMPMRLIRTLRALSIVLPMIIVTTLLAPAVATADPVHYTYTVSRGKATITGYTGPGGDITIPDSLGAGYPVVHIDFYAFTEISSITRVTLPAGLETIREGAFSFCTRLNGSKSPRSSRWRVAGGARKQGKGGLGDAGM